MSLRVGWNSGSAKVDECQDVVMKDSPSWTATNAVLKAGRGFSSWLLSNVSPPSSLDGWFFPEALDVRTYGIGVRRTLSLPPDFTTIRFLKASFPLAEFTLLGSGFARDDRSWLDHFGMPLIAALPRHLGFRRR